VSDVDTAGGVEGAPTPRRIVSLVPSATETLFELGAGGRLVGRTRYCVHPQGAVEELPSVGGTKDPDGAAIEALRPDLIVVNAEENVPAQFPALEAIAPLHEATPRTVDEALDDLAGLARRVGCAAAGRRLVEEIALQRRRARAAAAERRPFRYAYLIWRQPWMTINGDTYVAALLAEVGGQNVFADRGARYPEITLDELLAARPDRVLLASEPYPFAAGHAGELGPLAGCARLVDGELLCWHGSRMAAAFPYLTTLDRP
jgi:ABC-type Fe3+-hydroxamate transport system substrate-binding protein